VKIKGEFRDVLSRNGALIEDRGWRSNTIVPEFGDFLAAVMKKDFEVNTEPKPVGIEYIAVGSSSGNNAVKFKNRVKTLFNTWNNRKSDSPPLVTKENEFWIWVKKIETGDITYLDGDNQVTNNPTNTLQISVNFGLDEPVSKETLGFKEFALLGILQKAENEFDKKRMFFINHASHGLIEKGKDMTIRRTVKLTFPC
jgi:hypothetical protein